MADKITHRMAGMEAALASMEQLEQLPRKKAVRFALRKAANLVRDNARERAVRFDDPKTDVSIAENIAVRFDGKHLRRAGELKMSVGVKGGAKSGAAYHWRFLEFGTVHMAAQPFMRPALSSNAGAATDEFALHFGKAITRAVKKANRGR